MRRLGAFIVAVDDALFEATAADEVERLELLMAEAEATQVDGRYFQRPDVLEYMADFPACPGGHGACGQDQCDHGYRQGGKP